MSDLTLARSASETVMGMQVYERAVDARADAAIAALSPDVRIRRVVVRSVRAPLDGNRRLPMAAVLRARPWARSQVARWLYPGDGVVHRMDLGLPPARTDIVTVHDGAPWRFPDEGDVPPAAMSEIQRSRAIVTVSRFSADEIVHLLGLRQDPVVIPNGVDRARFVDATPLTGAERDALGIGGPYVLASGGASLRKNLEGLAEAWRMIRSARPDLTLVMTGPPHPRRDSLFAPLPGVRRVGRLPDSVLPRVLAGCSALVIPSLYEGFGLPAIEGMAAGVPVVAMDTSSLPEVLGDTGILTDTTPEALAEGVIWAVSGDSEVAAKVLAARQRSLAFTWENSAAEHARVWADVMAGR